MPDLQMTEQDAASIGPRDMKAPGDPAWCWQTVKALQTMWKALDINLDLYVQTWAEAEEHQIWEKIPYDNPYATKEKMLEQLSVGDDVMARALTSEQAVSAIPLGKNGGVRVKGQPDAHKAAYGQSAAYLSARIARDHPDILERMVRGEFKSVAAAARAAGILQEKQRPKKVAVNGDSEKLARSIQEILGPDEFTRFVNIAMCLLADVEVKSNC